LKQEHSIHRITAIAVLLAFALVFQLTAVTGYTEEGADVITPLETPPDTVPPDTTNQNHEDNTYQSTTTIFEDTINFITELL